MDGKRGEEDEVKLIKHECLPHSHRSREVTWMDTDKNEKAKKEETIYENDCVFHDEMCIM